MAKRSDVTLTVDLPGVTPTGVSINFTAGAVPVCTVDLAPAPPETIKISGASQGILSSPDRYKRILDVSVDVSVKSHTGNGEPTTRTLSWSGLFDGLSVGNTVGANTYQAVLKGKAQTLLELTTMTPGLTPTSVNIYRSPFFSIVGNAEHPDQEAERFWGSKQFTSAGNIDPTANPFKYYIDWMKYILRLQRDEYFRWIGTAKTLNTDILVTQLYSSEKYKRAVNKGLALLDAIDISAVDSGAVSRLQSSQPLVNSTLRDLFHQGPSTLLENLMNFLSFMGCTLVCGASKLYVVPERSCIKQSHTPPGKAVVSSKPNVANPADYNGYVYNDNGYKDIMAVVLSNPTPLTGQVFAKPTHENSLTAYYKDPGEITQASGVLIINAHPFLLYTPNSEACYSDAKKYKLNADSSKKAFYSEPKKFGVDENKESHHTRAVKKENSYYDILKDVATNYAQTKFYQARYADRQGTITLDFNPNWVPGASGNLYVRETGMFIDFFVESVTHRIDMTAPAGGSAITVINFSCGRLGSTPIGVDQDKFLGYNAGKESSFINSFISDIGGS
jgi:hypothetical protein